MKLRHWTGTVAILGAAMLLLGGCDDGCEPEAMRCRANAVEQCNADGDWYVVEHCGQVTPEDLDWTCCWVADEDLFACLPADACKIDGGTR